MAHTHRVCSSVVVVCNIVLCFIFNCSTQRFMRASGCGLLGCEKNECVVKQVHWHHHIKQQRYDRAHLHLRNGFSQVIKSKRLFWVRVQITTIWLPCKRGNEYLIFWPFQFSRRKLQLIVLSKCSVGVGRVGVGAVWRINNIGSLTLQRLLWARRHSLAVHGHLYKKRRETQR